LRGLTFPKPLHRGSRVALVAPSSPLPEGRLEPAVEAVRRMGLEPVVYPSVTMRRGYLAGTDEARAADLNRAFADERIEGVLCVRGGCGAQRLFTRLDLENMRRHPKVFAGYSDATFLHIALNQLCGMGTFHTPMPSTEWYEGLDAYTLEWLEKALFGGPWGALENPCGQGRVTVAGGCAEGVLMGGNLSLAASACGTPYALKAAGGILFLEDVGEQPYRVEGMLRQLIASGALCGCKGVVLGYFTDCAAKDPESSLTLTEIFSELLGPLGVPVLAGVACGHSLPTLSLPLGAWVRLDADRQELRVLGE
jgi:muramoyltetrapeptide carboxypeptidase